MGKEVSNDENSERELKVSGMGYLSFLDMTKQVREYEAKLYVCFMIVTGDIFDLLTEEERLFMLNYTKIYARMTPESKTKLTELFKRDKDNIVLMCGDGANDCGALLNADVGVAISHEQTKHIASHFYSKGTSIKVLMTILKHCRSCFENGFISLKAVLLLGLSQALSQLLLLLVQDKMTFQQLMIQDVFVHLVPVLAMTVSSSSSYNLKKYRTSNESGFSYFMLLLVHSIVIVTSLSCFFIIRLLFVIPV